MERSETVIDVTTVVPRERHPRIFGMWEALPTGQSLLLVNDHDPLPLYYQFAAENQGGFRWEYLERGPQRWRVLISKGDYADPGFVPGPARPRKIAVPLPKPEPQVLDIRPVFARGGSPCSMIDDAVAKLAPGQSLILLAPFEPRPLFTKLGALGFGHRCEALADGSYRVEFTPGTVPTAAVPQGASSCCGH